MWIKSAIYWHRRCIFDSLLSALFNNLLWNMTPPLDHHLNVWLWWLLLSVGNSCCTQYVVLRTLAKLRLGPRMLRKHLKCLMVNQYWHSTVIIYYLSLCSYMHYFMSCFSSLRNICEVWLLCWNLQDSDVSIRRRALELVFNLVSEGNVKALTKELLEYLKISDPEFKVDLAAKIATLVQK